MSLMTKMSLVVIFSWYQKTLQTLMNGLLKKVRRTVLIEKA